ncbi:MAG: rRNA pseudouridine synthase [Chitinophagaceae bacterium]|jgi:23S rRNA pseudouridine2605 synthase|nr:rRNA pseudouridine synthase [Chitinophagaceae bacterium]OQY96137.1 MAG: pseudouridine synthase [Sphingobacteriales bacterium UTBCD1]
MKKRTSVSKQGKSNYFAKFAGKKSNAARKEEFRKEKREWKKEREAYFEKKKKSVHEFGIGNRQTTGNLKPSSGIQLMPLNKFIAHCGVCSRRDAAEMIKLGKVKVNGEMITEPGHRVSSKDEIKVNGKKIFPARNLVYILLNKPKDYITTTDDPQGRKTVLDLIHHATNERIYPVGRLDRNTSGVLLLTNDGELSQKLTHPSYEVRKVYHITLNRPLDKKDFDLILKGVTLEDGAVSVDSLAYADSKDKTQIGIEIHSGRNRIVRRIFEHLGYDVKSLDRVTFAGFTKKNLERGKWRFLTEKEIRDLKYFGKGK